MALEFEPLEELDDELEEAGALPRVVVDPRRLVAAVNADEAFGATVATEEFELEPDEFEVDEFELEAVVEDDESRPRPLRLPIRRGVIRDT